MTIGRIRKEFVNLFAQRGIFLPCCDDGTLGWLRVELELFEAMHKSSYDILDDKINWCSDIARMKLDKIVDRFTKEILLIDTLYNNLN